MTPADDTPRQIEAGLERDRSALASTLDELTHRASIDYIAREALGMIRINTSDMTRTTERALRDNPVAFGLIGLGLAWLMLGGKDKSAHRHRLHADDPDPDWHRNMDSLRARARDALARIEDEARSSVNSLQSQVRDYAAERAQVLEDFTRDFRQSLSDGLEHLTDSAREQVIAARQQAYAAWLRAERMVRGGTREVVAVVEDHPVASGAVALAAGAAVGIAVMKAGAEDRAASTGSRARSGHSHGRWTRHRPAIHSGGLEGEHPVSTGGAGSVEGSARGKSSGPFGGPASTGAFPPA